MEYFDMNDKANTDTDLAGASSVAAILAVLQASGVTLTASQAAALTATDTQHKTDVNVPEVLTGMNALTQKRALAQETTQDNFVNQILQNGITQQHLVTTNEINNSDLIAKQAIRHSDLAIDRIWNPDEIGLAVTAALARFFATLNNPIPPLKT
jgi:hypothetical protein